MEDPAALVTKLDLDGCIRLPQWNDGPKVSLSICSLQHNQLTNMCVVEISAPE